MSDKKKWKSKNVADGRKQSPPKSINDIIGFAGHSNYTTHDIKEYENQLNAMATADLQSHAIRIGVKPSSGRKALVTRLLREFKTNNSSYGAALDTDRVRKNNKMTKKARETALKIMSDGK